jgi:hypothetical protein
MWCRIRTTGCDLQLQPTRVWISARPRLTGYSAVPDAATLAALLEDHRLALRATHAPADQHSLLAPLRVSSSRGGASGTANLSGTAL